MMKLNLYYNIFIRKKSSFKGEKEKDLKINWNTSKPNGDLRRQMDITKQTEIGLLPKLGFEAALKKTYEYYDKHK